MPLRVGDLEKTNLKNKDEFIRYVNLANKQLSKENEISEKTQKLLGTFATNVTNDLEHYGVIMDAVARETGENFKVFEQAVVSKLNEKTFEGHGNMSPKDMPLLYASCKENQANNEILEKLAEAHEAKMGEQEKELLGKDSAFYKFFMDQDESTVARKLDQLLNAPNLEGERRQNIAIDPDTIWKIAPPELVHKITTVMQKLEKREENRSVMQTCIDAISKFAEMIKSVFVKAPDLAPEISKINDYCLANKDRSEQNKEAANVQRPDKIKSFVEKLSESRIAPSAGLPPH